MRRPSRRALLASLALLILIGGALFVLFAKGGSAPDGVTRAATETTESPREAAELERVVDDTSEASVPLAPAAVTSERAAANDGATARLSVRVKVGRQPVSGATVRAVGEAESADEAVSVSTNAKGRARLDVRADRDLAVEVELPGDGVVLRRDIVAPPAGTSKTVVFDLGRVATSRSLTFEVVSMPSGAPLDANVTARGPSERGRRRGLGSGRADDRGRIILPWGGAGSLYRAEASHHSAWEQSIPERPEDGAPIRIDLVQHSSLFGTLAPRRATDPLRRARRRFVRIERAGIVGNGDRRIVPNAAGEWGRGGLQFRRATDAYTGARVLVDDGRTTRIVARDLTVFPGETVEVADLFDGAPGFELEVLKRANVRWTKKLSLAFVPSGAQEYSPWLSTTVEGAGEVEIDRLPKGRWDVYSGTLDARYVRDPLAAIEHDGSAEQSIVLSGFVPVEGKVLWPDGTPARYLDLTLQSGEDSLEGATRSDGTFALSIVEEGTACAIEVTDPRDRAEIVEARESSGAVVVIGDGARPESEGPLEVRVEFIANGDPITIRL
ncbi:MAG: hypothetical protein AAF957_07695 [Planctomycetota bacterium]